MKLIYFAWLRERIGLTEEVVDLPPDVRTIEDLMQWLSERDEAHAHAFGNRRIVRAAIDRRHVKPAASIAGAGEIAFFPPMTGG
ncbi:molybdopterin converting factor subunit 1 [Labrys monachus]|uniref:Molybdopterin synthase sulfur carrier subunit n=1 Tax=Labrys monachus TaxID=217067 RepID=A0ABU0FAV4_9HYPH|nr:molybdopterin converting factor subunit 1 [Labrys monachus]MDQ0391749.1 molybdopterin synthase sulfur carrier subunit [Labrys monachus]